jgi:hypothetical protein
MSIKYKLFCFFGKYVFFIIVSTILYTIIDNHIHPLDLASMCIGAVSYAMYNIFLFNDNEKIKENE